MLVLSRKVGQKIWIGDDIEVTVVRVAQGTVRLGIEAPEQFAIVREEIQNTQVAPTPEEENNGSRPRHPN